MIPQFTSQTDLIGFIRALPKNANYSKMLSDDFGIDAPDDAPAYQKEYTYKYFLQGTYKGVDRAELVKYAAEGVDQLMKTLPHLKAEPIESDLTPSPILVASKSKKPHGTHPDNVPVFLEHRNVWVIYRNSVIKTTKKTEAAALAWIAKKGA